MFYSSTDTAVVTRVQQPRMGKQMTSPCLANLPAAVVGCLSRLIPTPHPPSLLSPSYFSTSPLPFWLKPEFGHCKDPGPAKPEAHEGVRTDIYLDGNRSNVRLRRKRTCRNVAKRNVRLLADGWHSSGYKHMLKQAQAT